MQHHGQQDFLEEWRAEYIRRREYENNDNGLLWRLAIIVLAVAALIGSTAWI
jgi:hypothetical protein